MWLIIGYGNCLRGDDGAGPRVAELLTEKLSPGQAKVIITHQLTPELSLEIAAPEIQHVMFVDVKRDQEVTTEISFLHPAAAGSCGHQLSPHLLLQLSAKLYDSSVPGWLLTVAGKEFGFSAQLSPFARDNVELAVSQVLTFMATPFDTRQGLATFTSFPT